MPDEIEEIEKQIFFICMADHLSDKDYESLDELNKKLRILKGE